MKRLALATILMAILPLTSCVNTPKTIISYSPGLNGGVPKFHLAAPKDSDIQGLEYTRSNDVVSLKIRSYKARMNPAVIEASALGQAQIIDSVGNIIDKTSQVAAKAFMSGGASLAPGIGGTAPVGTSRPIGSSTNAPPR